MFYKYKKLSKKSSLKGHGKVRSKKSFAETIMDKIFGKSSSFHVK